MWWLVVPVVLAQGSLADAAERARSAWLAHDSQGLVGQGGSLVLQIPGADPLVPLDRAQASELLRRHWRNAVERSLTLPFREDPRLLPVPSGVEGPAIGR